MAEGTGIPRTFFGQGSVNLGFRDTGRGASGGDGGGGGGQVSGSQGFNVSQSSGQQQSASYIPDYLESPILRQIAQYSSQMAPQVYQWGMEQFNKNQGNIDAMMRNALSYGSAQRVASEVGKAQAGVMRGAEAGRQNAIRELQGYGIDPSSGRYAALDKANQVMAGAAAAGAGNMQRDVVQKTAGEMQTQAQQASNQNLQTGYGASNAMNQLLSTGMQLKFPPLGTTSSGSTQSSGSGATQSYSGPAMYTPAGQTPGSFTMPHFAGGGDVDATGYSGDGMEDSTSGGFVSHELSPSAGSQVDDVDARLNAGEFVIPKDVAEWKGQEFFYKLMAQARKMRATAGQENGTETETGDQNAGEMTGYARGGDVDEDEKPKRRHSDGYQVAGDVVPLPIMPGPQAGYPTRTERESGVISGMPRLPSPGFGRALDMGQQQIRGLHPRGYQAGGEVRQNLPLVRS